jgi:hypothetical protein
MKTEAASHAHAVHAAHHAHRPAATAASAADPAQNDPFAQLLAELFTDDPGVTAVDRIMADATTDAQAENAAEDITPETNASLPQTASTLTSAPAENPLNAALATSLLSAAQGIDTSPTETDPPPQALVPDPAASTGDGSKHRGNPVADVAGEGGLGHSAGPAADAGTAGAPFGQWVSTLARAKQRPTAGTRATAAESANASPVAEDARARSDATGPHGTAGAARLDALLASAAPAAAQALAGAEPNGLSVAGDRREAARTTDGPTTGNPGIGDPGSAPAATEGAESADFGLQLGAALADTFEAIGAQVSLWASGKTQRASFSVREGLDDPLSVDVTLNDGVAQLRFRTDDAALRQLIQAQAPTALADALARAGLALGGMEVGGQSAQGQGQDSGTPAAGRAVRMGLTALTGTDTAGPVSSARLQRDRGDVGLDVYA